MFFEVYLSIFIKQFYFHISIIYQISLFQVPLIAHITSLQLMRIISNNWVKYKLYKDNRKSHRELFFKDTTGVAKFESVITLNIFYFGAKIYMRYPGCFKI